MKFGLPSVFKFAVPLAASGLTLSLGILANFAFAKPAQAAEEIRLLVGGPLIFSVSVDSLDTYAQSGEISEDLRLFTRFANEAALGGLQRSLLTEIPLNVQQIDNLGYSALGEDLLAELGKVVRPHVAVNGDRALRGAVLNAAASANGEAWTPIDVLRQYPGKTIDIRLKDLQSLRRLFATYFAYNQAVVGTLQAQSDREAAGQTTLPENLKQPGPYAFEASTETFVRTAPRQTRTGFRDSYAFEVDIFLPKGLEQPAPVVFASHGYSDSNANLSFLGEHLASHGYVVLIPEHVGSDLAFRLNYTNGLLDTAINPAEYVSRPREISFLIDQLEERAATSAEWAALVDLDRIGIIGSSLGSTTAQSLAGAKLNLNRLSSVCGAQNELSQQAMINLNPSFYLQCQARFLSPVEDSLKDSRIKAMISANGLSSALFGPAGLEQIEMPFMSVSASRDVIAPSVPEQIHPFFWVGSDEKHLAVMPEGSHFSFTLGAETGAISPLNQPGAEALRAIVIGDYRDVGSRYLSALNLAFWNVYLKGDRTYLPYLSARYAQQLSEDEPVALNIVEQITPEDLVNGYGQQPPTPIFPTRVESSPMVTEPSR